MDQLFLTPQAPDLENLKTLLAEAIATRKRLRQAWLRSQGAVKRLQRQLRQATRDARRKPKRVKQREETL